VGSFLTAHQHIIGKVIQCHKLSDHEARFFIENVGKNFMQIFAKSGGIFGIHFLFFFWRPFVKRFAMCYSLSDRCVPRLSVTLVYCGQTVGWITMRLGMEVGFGPRHVVLDRDSVFL